MKKTCCSIELSPHKRFLNKTAMISDILRLAGQEIVIALEVDKR